jgi:hypothetical protein
LRKNDFNHINCHEEEVPHPSNASRKPVQHVVQKFEGPPHRWLSTQALGQSGPGVRGVASRFDVISTELRENVLRLRVVGDSRLGSVELLSEILHCVVVDEIFDFFPFKQRKRLDLKLSNLKYFALREFGIFAFTNLLFQIGVLSGIVSPHAHTGNTIGIGTRYSSQRCL